MRGLGHLPDDGQKYVPILAARDPRANYWASRNLASPPSRVSLRDKCPGILDQGTTSSCVGHAVVGACYTTLRAQGQPTPLGDPGEAYRLGLSIDRRDPSVALVDAGSQPNQVVRGVAEYGLTMYRGPVDPATITDELSLAELEAASVLRLSGAYTCSTPEDVRLAIASGYAVCFAVEVDQAFNDNAGQTLTSVRGATRGSHYIYCIGYDTTLAGSHAYEFVNSWGTTWGSVGYGVGDDAFQARWFDMLAMKVRKVS